MAVSPGLAVKSQQNDLKTKGQTGILKERRNFMDGKQRREMIINLMNASQEPLSGTALAKKFGVCRQVIVQDCFEPQIIRFSPPTGGMSVWFLRE